MNNDRRKVFVGYPIFMNEAVPALDYRYGPYNSRQEAFDYLGEDGLDVLCVGLTVGIRNSDGSITEYWFEKAIDTVEDLVEKKASNNDKSYFTANVSGQKLVLKQE